tara:strand:+ start:311 stop:685 length:375 start_codon:yes stop_codon:yes gene_type:complete
MENENQNSQAENDHEKVIHLEKETEEQAKQIAELQSAINHSEAEKIELVKQQNQSAIVRLVFGGICSLLIVTMLVSVGSWFAPAASTSAFEKTMALSERILLVLSGILSSVVASVFESKRANGG